jgi:hypothetical protein
VSAWGHFAFTHWPEGRGYAEFLTSFFRPEAIGTDAIGRLAQDALYYHEGPVQPAPQRTPVYWHQMQIPAGVRKAGPWQVALSGIMNSQAINSRFYLDRQGHVSVFHDKLGLIITGANSKRQPELATFSEKLLGQTVHMPISSRLQMGDRQDRLSLAYNTFFSDLYVPSPADEVVLRFVISGRGTPAEDPRLTLQVRLHPGESLRTGAAGTHGISADPLRLDSAAIGGSISHHGWTIRCDSASLGWPVYPHNPYSDAPETSPDRAVATLSVPLRLKAQRGKYVRPDEQEIVFRISADR